MSPDRPKISAAILVPESRRWLTSTTGQDRPLENLLHSCRSIQGSLQTGHSIGTIDFSGLNFGYAAEAACGHAVGIEFGRRLTEPTTLCPHSP
jgi:hypothetical protein